MSKKLVAVQMLNFWFNKSKYKFLNIGEHKELKKIIGSKELIVFLDEIKEHLVFSFCSIPQTDDELFCYPK